MSRCTNDIGALLDGPHYVAQSSIYSIRTLPKSPRRSNKHKQIANKRRRSTFMNSPSSPSSSRPRRPSLQLLPPFSSYSSTTDLYSDARNHGTSGSSKTVRLPQATRSGGGAIAKSANGTQCVVAGRESLSHAPAVTSNDSAGGTLTQTT